MENGAPGGEPGERTGEPASRSGPPDPRPADSRTPQRDGSGRGRGRGADGGNRRRGERRAYAGFGDDLERAYCEAYRHLPPPDYPVQHRTGASTLRTVVVARREEEVLLCDGAHEGEHRWPDGEPVPNMGDATAPR